QCRPTRHLDAAFFAAKFAISSPTIGVQIDSDVTSQRIGPGDRSGHHDTTSIAMPRDYAPIRLLNSQNDTLLPALQRRHSD
ncbi:MAG: hypothetical protein O2856_16045, partial [Planctomycetota bacterium]|nr:hypothetical protein [Planctomycetota bacterium]